MDNSIGSSRFVLQSAELVIVPSREDDLWNSDWIISRKEGEQIGTASFAGEKALGVVPVYIEIFEQYRNQGHGTQALKMMVQWAFERKNVYEISAMTTQGNDKGIRILEKAGFVFRRSDGATVEYSIIKQRTSWTGLYLMLGIALGMALGVVSGNLWVGFVIGLVACLSIGATMDGKASKERAAVTGRKK